MKPSRVRAVSLPLCLAAGLLLAAFVVLHAEETSEYIHYQLGIKYKNEGKIEPALQEFNSVLAEYPDNYNAYYNIAELRTMQGQTRLVIYNLKKALAFNPGWAKAQKMLGEAYSADGQFQKAIMELQQYRQICDPQERKGVQGMIDSLILRARGQLGSGFEESPSAPAEAAPVKQGAAKPEAPLKKETAAPAQYKRPVNGMAETEFHHGVELFGDKKYDEAIVSFRKTLALAPGHAGAYYYAGLIRYHKGQNDLAKFNLRRAFAYPVRGLNAHFYLGKIFGSEKMYKDAIDELTLFVNKTASDSAREEANGLISVFKKALGGAAVAMDSLKISPNLSTWDRVESALEGKAAPSALDTAAMEERGGLEMRIDSMLSLALVDTVTDAGQSMLGGVRLFKANRFDDAIAEFKKVLLTHPSGEVTARSIYDIGILYVKLRLFHNAENQFQQVLDRFPGHAFAGNSLFLKALCLKERGEYSAAQRLFGEFIQKYRKHAWCAKAYEQLGDVFADLEQHAKAREAFDQAAATAGNPGDQVFALYKLGQAYTALANPERAIASFKKAIDVGEKKGVYVRVPDAYYRIGDYWYQQKKYAEALPYYQTASRKYPQYQETPWGLFQIAGIYKNTHDYKKAVAQYKELIARFPDDYWARQARWKLEDAVWENQYQAVLQ
ncbi:MAG: tetratricopeptide repeat protein [Chitinivibrionales bacterium]|nr:tetratricopeptide repeat protein [Chitinivibrionales bacterium]